MQTSLKNLSNYLLSKGLKPECLGNEEILGISSDSRIIKPGDLFVALSGRTVSGNQFELTAKKNGAVAILTSIRSNVFDSQIVVDDIPRALGILSSEFFGSRVEDQHSIGVTGTNGKTSISFLLAQAISYLDKEAVYGGTLGLKSFFHGVELDVSLDTDTTTPGTIDFHRFLGTRPNSDGFVVEISSIALDQSRLCGLELGLAIFSNLTRDHLDYHKTLDEYFATKKKLFLRDLKESSKANKTAILNIRHENLRQFAGELKEEGIKVWGYSVDPGTSDDHLLTRLLTSSLSLDGAEFEFEVLNTRYKATTKLIGHYNLENILAVISALSAIGYQTSNVVDVLPKLSGVPGRLQPVSFRKNNMPTVLIDYAHTPDALESVISSVRALAKGRLITVFGCGGDRDKGKRPIMADIVSRLSDLTIVTSDNPRREDPESIIDQILEGITPGSKSMAVVDRRSAIYQAISKASSTDTVLIAGKGHESYQEIDGIRHRFLDEEVASEALREFFN